LEYTVENADGDRTSAEIVIAVEREDLIRRISLDELDDESREEFTRIYNDWLFETAKKNLGEALAIELRDNHPTIERDGNFSPPTLEWIARLIKHGWVFEENSPEYFTAYGFGQSAELINFSRDVDFETNAAGQRVIGVPTKFRELQQGIFGTGIFAIEDTVIHDIPVADQAKALVSYLAEAQVNEGATGLTVDGSPFQAGATAFFSHPNTQFVAVAAAVALGGPAGFAAAGAFTGSLTVGGVTLATAAGVGQAAVAVGSAYAIARATDDLVGEVVDTNGDGVADRTLGDNLLDYFTENQNLTDDLVTSADIAVAVVEIGPGIFMSVKGVTKFTPKLGTQVKVVKSVSNDFFTNLLDPDTYCFSPDTLVSCQEGSRQISEIQVGENVFAYDFSAGEIVLAEVSKTHSNSYSGIWVTLELSSGDTIEVTGNHPFWVLSGDNLENREPPVHDGVVLTEETETAGKWQFSQDLKQGDTVLSRSGKPITVTQVQTKDVSEKQVCNLTVETHHNFIVSNSEILTHNISFCREILAKYAAGSPQRARLVDIAKNVYGKGSRYVHAHHIVMKVGRGVIGKLYTQRAQKLLRKYGIEVLDTKSSINAAKAAQGGAVDNFSNMTYALNGPHGIHSTEYQKAVFNKLAKAANAAIADGGGEAAVKAALKSELRDMETIFLQGGTFW